MKDIDLSSMINLTKQVFTLIEQEYQVFLSLEKKENLANLDYNGFYKVINDDNLPPIYFNQVNYLLNLKLDNLPNTIYGNYLKNKDLSSIYLELVPFFCFNYLAGDINFLKLGLIQLEINNFCTKNNLLFSSIFCYKELEVALLLSSTILKDLPYKIIFIDSEVEIFNYLAEEKGIEVAKLYHDIVKKINNKYKSFSRNNNNLVDFLKFYETINYEDILDLIYDFVNSKVI